MQAFFDISLLLALATVIALVMQWLRLPLLLGHILTGILAGPAVFNMLQHTSVIETFSQLGITALLFVVGLSLSPHVIREVGKVALATGLGQILFTTLFGFGLGMLLGYSWMTSLFWPLPSRLAAPLSS
jgi:Kef-type K+ transport system membrane component KefB